MLPTPITRNPGITRASAIRFLSDNGDADATEAGAVIVNVAFPPAVTEDGAIAHVAIGVGPFTEHESEIVPEKPPWAPKLRTSVI